MRDGDYVTCSCSWCKWWGDWEFGNQRERLSLDGRPCNLALTVCMKIFSSTAIWWDTEWSAKGHHGSFACKCRMIQSCCQCSSKFICEHTSLKKMDHTQYQVILTVWGSTLKDNHIKAEMWTAQWWIVHLFACFEEWITLSWPLISGTHHSLFSDLLIPSHPALQ